MNYPKMVYRAKPDCPKLADADAAYEAWKAGKIEFAVMHSEDDAQEGFGSFEDLFASEVMPLEPKRRGRPPRAE